MERVKLLLQPRGVVGGARGRHDVLLQSDDEHALEFQPLDGVDGRDRHIVAAVHLIGVRIERDLLQIVGERRFGIHAHELVDGVEKFLDIGEFCDGLVRLVGILSAHPRSVDETAHELVHRHRLRFEDDLLEICPEGAQFCLRAAADAQFVMIEHGVEERDVLARGIVVERVERAFADPAARDVDDARDRLAVKGIARDAQIGKDILDLLALEEFEAAEHLVGDAVLGKFLLVGAGERVDAHEDGKIGGLVAAAAEFGDLFGAVERLPRFLVRLVKDGRVPFGVLGVQRLALAAGVVCDGGVGEGQDRLGRAVILLQFIHFCVGIDALEPQDVFDLRAPPAVDGLVVVADDEEIAVDGREALDDLELYGVGVLKLVHMDVAELARKVFARLLVLLEEGERFGEQVVEIEGVARLQVRVVLFVHLDRRVDIALEAAAQPVLFGREPEHLGVGDVPLDRL